MKGVILFEADYCLLPVRRLAQTLWMKVDFAVALWAAHHSWCLRSSSSPYAVCKRNGRLVQLHALVNETPDGLDTDHVNQDKLDNRRSNLRTATRSQNMANCFAPNISKTSRWRGVSWVARKQRWRVSLRHRGRAFNLGYFLDEADAAMAYNEAALLHFGPFSHLNDHPDNAA